MHNRFSTPDILGSVMTGVQGTVQRKKENKKVVKAVVDEAKEKATFNLSIALLTELEDICHEIRKLYGSKRISKTLLVEEALKTAFSNFKEKKEKSSFFKSLESHTE